MFDPREHGYQAGKSDNDCECCADLLHYFSVPSTGLLRLLFVVAR